MLSFPSFITMFASIGTLLVLFCSSILPSWFKRMKKASSKLGETSLAKMLTTMFSYTSLKSDNTSYQIIFQDCLPAVVKSMIKVLICCEKLIDCKGVFLHNLKFVLTIDSEAYNFLNTIHKSYEYVYCIIAMSMLLETVDSSQKSSNWSCFSHIVYFGFSVVITL